MTIRVLIADDQDIIVTGLSTILNDQDDIEVVAIASDGIEALEKAHRYRPDVCLLDIRMPRLDGVETTRRLAGPEIDDPMAVVEVLLSVAKGLTNPEIADELFISLSTVKFHLASLMTKLDARNRIEIAIWAYETNRIPS